MRKPFIIVAVMALSIYFWPEISNTGWRLYTNLQSNLVFFPPGRVAITVVAPTAAAPIKIIKKIPVPENHDRIIIVQEVTEVSPYVPPITDQVVFPPAPPEHKDIETKYDPYESKTKRGLKAVGRFLKYKP